MRMVWFLPLGLGIGGLLTQAAIQLHKEARRKRRSRGWLLLLLLGWIPIVAWIASQFVEQY